MEIKVIDISPLLHLANMTCDQK